MQDNQQQYEERQRKRNTPLYKAYLELKERKRELMVQHNAYKSIGWRPYWVKDAGKWFAELNLEIGEVNRLKYENRQQRKGNGS